MIVRQRPLFIPRFVALPQDIPQQEMTASVGRNFPEQASGTPQGLFPTAMPHFEQSLPKQKVLETLPEYASVR